MILKEKQISQAPNPKVFAGDAAEKQMAFYLERAFGKENELFVINDLRIVFDNNVAQVDHLMVTKYGLFIIESKSVHGKIIVNKHNEWSRTYSNQPTGMSSPVLQAIEQGKILKNLLRNNKEKLLSKLLGALQKGFAYCPVFVYVAVSDDGIIDRNTDVPELFKADQITQAISKKIKSLKMQNSLLSLSLDSWEMRGDEAKTVAEFLLNQHQPLQKETKAAQVQPPALLKTTTKEIAVKAFIPKAGAICPICKKNKLLRKSVKRNDNTETDFLACTNYPSECKAIFALVAVAQEIDSTESLQKEISTVITVEYKENDFCPRCKTGKLVPRKAKTEFLGCSSYPKCKFTNYRN